MIILKFPNATVWSSITAFSIRWLSSLAIAILGFNSSAFGQTAEIVGRPMVKDDEITLRIKVTEDGERPAMFLEEQDFQAIVDNDVVDIISWKNPEESVPPPAWIIVLLDFSGSMKEKDSSGTTKLEGAIKATREFLETTSARGSNTRVAIFPFGEGRGRCNSYKVRRENIKSRFFPADDFKHKNLLDNLAKKTPCASTNIYDPLKEAIRLLSDQEDTDFYVPEDSIEPEPRLSVILLSDGYHNKKYENRDFRRLIALLERHDHIVVHTLGYGLTQEQLGKKYNLGRPATRADVNQKYVPAEEFVDQMRLQEIAEVTGGISEFSGDADDIAEALQLFLNALLGEYEIIYREPNPVRASKHEVFVTATVNGKDVDTTQKSYTINAFGRSLPAKTRLRMTGLVLLLLGLGGVLPFWNWSQRLKQETEEDF
ncbi:MAG: VWA domain-containing protein [Trichodesmium sp. St16_bin4-tuft]|nr:VWA domain-containing protein [Trichodesmium sp. St16_bin4-tuft]